MGKTGRPVTPVSEGGDRRAPEQGIVSVSSGFHRDPASKNEGEVRSRDDP